MIVMRRYLVLEQIKSCCTVTAVPMTVVKNFESLSILIFIQLVCVPMDVQRLIAEEHLKNCLLKEQFTKYYSSVIITLTLVFPNL